MRGGAYLVEEVLTPIENEISYRAYDVPSRCPVILHEFFPTGASRADFQVLAPSGWSTQGFDLAKAKWLQRHSEALAIFEENGTAYLVMSADSPRIPAPSKLQPEYSAPANPVQVSTPVQPPMPVQNNAPIRPLSFSNLWPDACRGAIQGGLLCGVAGVLLGAIASAMGDGNLLFGMTRGIWLFPVGAICGGFLGVLRALPSSARQLASVSPVTAQDQWQSAVLGALKGGLLGMISGIFLAPAQAAGAPQLPFYLKAVLLFALCGAIGGAVVGFIRINPRDRSRRN